MFERKVTKEEMTSMIQRVGNLELEIEKLKTHINSLRGLINRKRSEILDHSTETKELKSIDGLDSLR